MTIDEIVEKAIPPVLIGIVFSISMLFIKVNTLEHGSSELKRIASDYKDRADTTHSKQWVFISDLTDDMIELRTEQKHKLSKEEYHKGKQ